MDKAEYQVKLDQIKALVADQDYDGALDVVKGIDWRRVKNIRTLCMVADVYEANDMLEDSRRILLLALKRASIGKSILSRLVELSLMMNDTAGASEYYQDFIKAAPRDAARYLLQYKILKANQSSLDEQIEALHDYKESEYTERWAYELARLYDKAGREEECIEECDDIILWFSEGVYVVKAMELKMKHTALTPSQQEKYDHRFETMPELLEKEEPKFTKKKKKAEPAKTTVEKTDTESEPEATITEDVKEVIKPEKEAPRDDFVSTIDLQTRLSQGLKKVIGGMIHNDDNKPEQEEKEAEEEIFASVETDRYAPQLEPEQPAESGIRRDAVMTKPEAMKQEESAVTGDTFDFSAIFEAQADAFAAEEPEKQPDEETKADIQQPHMDVPETMDEPEEDDFDLSKLLESEVADILKEQKESRAAKTEIFEEIEPAIVEETVEEEPAEKEPVEEEPAGEAPVEEALAEQLEETPVFETIEPKQTESAVFEETVEKESADEPEFTFDFDLEKQIIDAAEAEVAAGTEEQFGEPQHEEDPIFDLEAQILKAAQPEEENEPEEIPAKTLDLQKQIEAEKAAAVEEELPELQIPAKTEKASTVEEELPELQIPAKTENTDEQKDAEFDLQALLAAEVSGIMANPEEPEEPADGPVVTLKKEEEDLVTRLEKEADRTMEHKALEKETPQDKRLRIMRAAPANRMTEEQKRVFTYFAKVPGMDTQILEALNQAYNGAVSKTSRHGNIAIMGRKGTGKTRLSEGLIKALCKEFEMSAAKFARIHARDLNKKDVAQVVAKLSGGFLVIEKASLMTDDTIMKLNQAMDFRTDSMILIVEDEKEDMKNMLESHPEFAEKFDAVIKIPVFTNDELVTFARTYAGECGYKMDEMGILALYTIIGANQSVDEPVSIAKVKEMVDAAIAKASKGGRKIGRKLSGRQVDRMNRIILYEKDFEL